MRLEDAETRPAVFPAVDDPTPAELQTGARWSPFLSEALAATWRRFLGKQPIVQVSGPQLAEAVVVDERWRTRLPAGTGLWLVSAAAETAAQMVDLILAGGPGEQARSLTATDRELLALWSGELGRQIEQQLPLEPVAEGAISTTSETLSRTHELCWQAQVQIAGSSLTVELRADWSELRSILRAASPAPAEGLMREAIGTAPVTLEAIFSGPMLSAAELVELRPGDVICMGSPNQLVQLKVAGQSVAVGKAGAKGGRLAVSIRQINQGQEE